MLQGVLIFLLEVGDAVTKRVEALAGAAVGARIAVVAGTEVADTIGAVEATLGVGVVLTPEIAVVDALEPCVTKTAPL